MRSVVHLILLTVSANAQFYDFLADWSSEPPADKRAFEARITATLKARTPWGEKTTVESGTYWRSSDGRDRFDNAYGSSTLRDRRGPILRARIDHEQRLLEIEENIAALHPDSARAPWAGVAFSPRDAGQKTVEGLTVTVRKGSDHGVNYEVWASDELGILLFVQYKTDRTVFEQRIHDIRFVEPDPRMMEVPREYRTHITCWLRTGEAEAPRQTYESGQTSCPGVGE